MPIVHARTAEAVEEERRLLYVAVTRARVHLALSWAPARTPGGGAVRQRSRFLSALRADGPASADQAGSAKAGSAKADTAKARSAKASAGARRPTGRRR